MRMTPLSFEQQGEQCVLDTLGLASQCLRGGGGDTLSSCGDLVVEYQDSTSWLPCLVFAPL